MQQIKVGEYTVEIVRKSIKNMHLRVYPPDGRLQVTAPLDLNEEAIRRFITSKQGWIGKHQEHFQQMDRYVPKQYVTGESHFLAGKMYRLEVIPDSSYSHIRIRDDAYIELYTKAGADFEQRREMLAQWYRALLKGRIEPLIRKWQKIMNVEAKQWSIKQMKTKWGTCNIPAGRIWLNLELAKRSERCLEYIIVHELLHLIERHHNEVFKAHMDRLLPDWKERRKELNGAL